MKLTKKKLKRLIAETVKELHEELKPRQVSEASTKKFKVHYKNKRGIDKAITVKARDKEDAMAAARQKLRGKFYDLYYAKELDEITTTANVAGYDAPFGMKISDLIDDEDDD